MDEEVLRARVKANYGFFERLIHGRYLMQIESQAEEIRSLSRESKDNSALASRFKREKDLAEQIASGLEVKLSNAEARAKTVEQDPRRRLGNHIWDDSQCGVLFVNQDNVVVMANENACEYLALEEPAVIGSNLSELAHGNELFGQYIALFVEYSQEVASQEKVQFEPNTFNMKKAAFNIMAYQDVSEGDYVGGFVVLTPHVSSGFIGKLVSDWKKAIYVEGAVTYEQTLGEYALPLMSVDEDKKSVHIDLENVELIETRSIDTLVKGLGVLTRRNTNCVFVNVPADIAKYLHDKYDLGKKHIRSIQRSRKVLASAEEIRMYKTQQNLEQTGSIPFGGELAPDSA